MAWIQSHQELARHPKTLRLAKSLDCSVPQAVGHLHLLWWWALDFAEDGDVTSYSTAELARVAGWEGQPSAFTRALHRAGFLEKWQARTLIHDWWDYAGKIVERRKSDAARKRQSRTSDGSPTDIPRMSTPRVEKSREEKSTGSTGTSYPGRGQPPAAKEAAAYLKDQLKSRGVTYFPRDWHLSAAAVAGTLLKELTTEQVREAIDWALAHQFWGPKVNRMEKVRDLIPEWQQERNGYRSGPPARLADRLMQSAMEGGESDEPAAGQGPRRQAPRGLPRP